jgi:hypothetical protein
MLGCRNCTSAPGYSTWVLHVSAYTPLSVSLHAAVARSLSLCAGMFMPRLCIRCRKVCMLGISVLACPHTDAEDRVPRNLFPARRRRTRALRTGSIVSRTAEMDSGLGHGSSARGSVAVARNGLAETAANRRLVPRKPRREIAGRCLTTHGRSMQNWGSNRNQLATWTTFSPPPSQTGPHGG